MPEISEVDNELLKLSRKALGGKQRISMLRILKTESPDVALPELDAEDRIAAIEKAHQDEIKKIRDEHANDKATADLEKKRAALVAKGIDVAAVEKVMLEKGITNHEAAAEFISLNRKPAAPATPFFDRSATVPQDELLKKNPAQFARETAAKVIEEFAVQKR